MFVIVKKYSGIYIYIKMKVPSIGNGFVLSPRTSLSNELEIMPRCFAFSVIFIDS